MANIIPGLTELTRAYNALYLNKPQPTSKDIIKYGLWSRFDPRLGEVLVSFLREHWMTYNPIQLREVNLKTNKPQVFLVILEHVEHDHVGNQNIFKHFKGIIEEGMGEAPYQSYTIGIYSPGGRTLFEQARRPHPFFKKWGFYESDPFYNKAEGKKIGTLLDRETRKNILRALLREQSSITVNDYLAACRFAVDRRQAERDLKTFFKLKKTGNTRSRRYARR